MAARRLRTVDDVITFLGGVHVVAQLTGRPVNQVYNWRAQGRFGSATYLVMTHALRKRRRKAPPELWGIEPATRSAA